MFRISKSGPLALASLAMLLAGCAGTRAPWRQPWLGLFPSRSTEPSHPTGRPPGRLARRTWMEGVFPGKPAIEINLAAQRAYFLKGKAVVGETDISSGRAGYDTPPGNYTVIQRDKEHRSNLYGAFVDGEGTVVNAQADLTKQRPPPGTTFVGAKMPYFLRIHEGYGLHAGHLPGHAASHGCVRLPLPMAQHFYENAPLGTAVSVLP